AGVSGRRVAELEAAASLALGLFPVLLVARAESELEDEVGVLRIVREPFGDDRARALDVTVLAANRGEARDEHRRLPLAPPVLVLGQELPAPLEVFARLLEVAEDDVLAAEVERIERGQSAFGNALLEQLDVAARLVTRGDAAAEVAVVADANARRLEALGQV